MKKGVLIFFRVIFVVLLMIVAAYFAAKTYFQYESQQAITKALQMDDAPVVGDPSNPFTIVEFFDYRCTHCYPFAKIVYDAIGDDINNGTTKILLRPTIVGDEHSLQIAKLVLAADRQKKGETIALHQQIMQLSTIPTYDTVKAMATARGLDVAQAEKDGEAFQSIIIKNTELARHIGFSGVPALVIGDKGYMQYTSTMPGVNELKLMMLDAKTRLNIVPNKGD